MVNIKAATKIDDEMEFNVLRRDDRSRGRAEDLYARQYLSPLAIQRLLFTCPGKLLPMPKPLLRKTLQRRDLRRSHRRSQLSGYYVVHRRASLRVTGLVQGPRHRSYSSSHSCSPASSHSPWHLIPPMTGAEPPPPRTKIAHVMFHMHPEKAQLPSAAKPHSFLFLLFPAIISAEVTLQCKGGTQNPRPTGLP